MATLIYLGMPPENIKQFIIENYGPKEDPLTKVTFSNGNILKYDIQGTISYEKLVLLGLYTVDDNGYPHAGQNGDVTEMEIGSNVTRIEDFTFNYIGLYALYIPHSVTSIGKYSIDTIFLKNLLIPSSVNTLYESTFGNQVSDTTITFEGKTINDVKNLSGYPFTWSISNSIFKCTDGDITF